MPEERKPAPLPPLPWKRESSSDGWIRLFDADNRLIARIDAGHPAATAVADLFCRAPALESEIARRNEVVDWAGEILARHAGVEAEAGEENANG